MRVTSWNVNGLRSALRRGVERHLAELDPDVVLLQEIRASPAQLPWTEPPGWRATWHPSERAGWSGVATWSRGPHETVGRGMGDDAVDPDGRILRTLLGDVEVVNVYAPSGARGLRQPQKDAWLEAFLPFAARLAEAPHAVLLGGDLNVAPTELDLHDPGGNKKNSGFLPNEREWFRRLLGLGWTDLVRTHVGEVKGPYSWWSNLGRARELDRGWRIDHLLGNAAAAARLQRAWIHRAGGLEVSDHAPVTVELAP